MTNTNGIRLQSSMRTNLVEDIHHGNKINKIELGRVTKVNYQTNSVGFILVTTGVNGARASANKTYSAVLPMSFAGRNGYGKAYGDITPVRVNDIILVGFVDDKTYKPIVIGIYPDESIAQELTRSADNDIDPDSVIDFATADASFKVYPDQTYNYHDGIGTRTLSFSGHSFLLVNANVVDCDFLEHKTDDGIMPLDYVDLPTSFFANGETIEPVKDTAPEILFKHQGIVDKSGNVDKHALYLYISQDGTYRVSQMRTDEDWRTYFEIKNSEIRLIRQKNSKVFGGIDVDSLNSSGLIIDDNGNLTLRNHTTGICIKSDGIYTLAGEKLMATKNAISDLILDKLGGLGFGGANIFSKSTSTKNKFLDENDRISDVQGALVSDYIECIGNNAYYAYAYAANDVFDKEITLSLVVYDSDKNYIEGKEVKGKANVQIATRSLPSNSSYMRVSISDESVPIMLAFGSEYSAYQPSYLDMKANKNAVTDTADKVKGDYLETQMLAKDALSDKTLAMQNINEIAEDNNLSTADKQLISSYLQQAKDNYDKDTNYALKYDVSIDDYKNAYNKLLGRIQPVIADLTQSTLITGSQIIDIWDVYFTSRYNFTSKLAKASEAIYTAYMDLVNNAEIEQNSSMVKQFTNVTQTLQAITQTVTWTVFTDDIDLDEEVITENLLFKGSNIKHSPISGYQYIQVFSSISADKSAITSGVTQKVWSIDNIVSYSRLLTNGRWSDWLLDSTNADYNNALNNIDNRIKDTNGKLTDLTTTTESIQEKINNSQVTLQDYRKTNDKRVTKVENDLVATNTSITNVSGRVDTNTTDIAAINKKLDNLTSTIGTINSSLNDLTSKVDKLTNKVNELSKKP